MTQLVSQLRTIPLAIVAVAMSTLFALACGSPSAETAGGQPSASDDAAPARPAPLFKLPDANAPAGTEVALAQFRDAQPVVLVFYRAHW